MSWRAGSFGAMVGLLGAGLGVFDPASAEACSPPMPAPPTALPAPGTVNVSTATSLIVIAPTQPSGLTLLANGQNVPLAAPIGLGSGVASVGPRSSFWRVTTVDSMLPASAEHVLSQTKSDGSALELTRFTTAAGYDKVPGTAPVLRSVRLWRVRYPLSAISSGNCVFAEYHGFITADYDPGTVPNTPAASVVHTFQLAPKTGGSAQTFVYARETPFVGMEPVGDYPTPTGLWHPELDPTREYCLTVSAFGDGDIARLGAASQPACAEVVQLSVPGAPPPPVIGGGPAGGDGGSSGNLSASGGGGCAITGAASSAVAVWMVLVAFTLGARRRR